MDSLKDSNFSCSKCTHTWQKNGKTYCWSDTTDKVATPKDCPTANMRVDEIS